MKRSLKTKRALLLFSIPANNGLCDIPEPAYERLVNPVKDMHMGTTSTATIELPFCVVKVVVSEYVAREPFVSWRSQSKGHWSEEI